MSCENEILDSFPICAANHTAVPPAPNDFNQRNYTSVSCDMLLPNVFVRIPTNHLVPSKGPITRHCDEIKAEMPIKSEVDNVQQSINGRLTKETPPPAETTSIENVLDNYRAENCDKTNDLNGLPTKLVTARPKSVVKCIKCELCPFMSITQNGYNDHMLKIHSNCPENENNADKIFRKKILCPGCENVFYSKMSLKIHLVNDHQMSQSEICLLLESLFLPKSSSIGKNRATSNKRLTRKKQKIYLKNVEVLKNPKFESQFSSPDVSQTMPNEQQTECLSSSMDGSNCNEESLNDMGLSRIQMHNIFSQLDNNMCELTSDIEPTFSMINMAKDNCQTNINMGNEMMPNLTPSPSDEVPIGDDIITVRSDSEHSVKYAENFLNNYNDWTITNSSNFEHYHQTTNFENSFIPTIKPATESCGALSPMPFSVCHNEKKKIFIKNIDILKEPLITPTSTINNNIGTESIGGRKNMLHLRTVDEVNLMLINKVQHENNYTSNDLNLAEDEYRYVLNDGIVDYNTSMLPQYLDSDVNDFVTNFSNETFLTATDYMTNYAGNSANSNYNLTNLETATAPLQNQHDANNIIVLNESIFDANQCERSNSTGNQFIVPTYDRHTIEIYPNNNNNNTAISGYNNVCYDEHNFPNNKFMENKITDNSDFMFVSSDEIINCNPTDDILDLTNDEVEHIFDNNLITPQCFDAFDQKECLTVQPTKARINVVGNLIKTIPTECSSDKDGMRSLETPQIDLVDDLSDEMDDKITDVKKKGGRPKGARRTNGMTSKTDMVMYKCSIKNCAMRFTSENVHAIHEQCHTSKHGTQIHCPKCETNANQTRNWNWNTLHTHLWREHNIDMELYSCTLCSFKTPILSRLKNTHMKIHSDTRDFKCDTCTKAFKNAKQLKNHRRIHTKQTAISECKYCGQSFYSSKHLKEHLYTHTMNDTINAEPLKCDICSDTFNSKHALRSHHLKHFTGRKFNCNECAYKSNDHNAFRRHQMLHNKQVKYKCPQCIFQCIQSTNYKNHIFKKHPESVKDLMFLCDKCQFVTVSKKMYDMHCLNHNRVSSVELE